MTTFKTNAEIDERGNLKLELPVGLPAGKAEVLVVVQPTSTPGPQAAAASARSGLFQNKLSGDIDIGAALDEINAVWKSKLPG